MGSFLAPNKTRPLGRQTAGILKNLQKYLPGYLRSIQTIQEELAPREQQLSADLFAKFGPQFSKTGSEIEGQEQLAEIANNLEALQGPGRELVSEAEDVDRMLNPEFYAQREAANAGYLSLLGGMDPNKLTGSETANVERGVNRINAASGNLNTGDATTTASNALLFDDRLQAKRQQFGQVLNLFPGISAASKSGINAFNVGTGKTKSGNVGTQQYQTNLGQYGQAGEAAQGNMFGTKAQIEELRTGYPTGLERGSAVWSSLAEPVCGCYIFRAHYGFTDVPLHVKICREYFYRKSPSIRVGYKKMADWIVPLMRKYPLVRLLMSYLCILPLAAYGEYLTGLSTWKWVFKPAKIWLTIWKYYGLR